MQLLTLALEDFQAHELRTLKFSPTITTIQGPTDVGKSAVLRALRWVCLNDIGGDDFIREGAKLTTVTLRIDVGEKHAGKEHNIATIKRIRGRHNTYELEDIEFKAFGTGVPTEIAQLLNLSTLNFQGQLDAPFWFSESAPEVSRQLNAVVDLSVIDSSLSYMAGQVRQATERRGLTQERLDEAKLELTGLLPQRARIEAFAEIKSKHEKREQLTTNRDQLADFIKKISGRQELVSQLNDQVKEGDALLKLGLEVRRFARRIENLRDVISETEKLQTKSVAPPSFADVDAQHEKWENAVDRAAELGELINAIERAAQLAKRKNREAFDADKDFADNTKGKSCPTCGKLM